MLIVVVLRVIFRFVSLIYRALVTPPVGFQIMNVDSPNYKMGSNNMYVLNQVSSWM